MRAALVKGGATRRLPLARWLKEGGVSVAVFRSASAFLASRERDGFDALLLDWAPTDMPGVAAAVRVRSACGMVMPIVFVGGPDAEAAIVSGLGCGADAYVAGPLRRLELLARIEAVVRRAC